MKHGLHIMLQRFVRSIVSTVPRPYLIVDVPCRWTSSSPRVRKSRPGYRASMMRLNSGSSDRTSSKTPCSLHSLRMTRRPSSSRMCALISPMCPFTSSDTSRSPRRIAPRVSITHFGHSESVSRGQPSGGLVFWWLFGNGPGAHGGVGDSFSGSLVFTDWSPRHPRSASSFTTALTRIVHGASS